MANPAACIHDETRPVSGGQNFFCGLVFAATEIRWMFKLILTLVGVILQPTTSPIPGASAHEQMAQQDRYRFYLPSGYTSSSRLTA